MSNVSGIYFSNQKITSKGIRTFAKSTNGDGVISGCSVSFSGASLNISPGYLIACGALCQIPSTLTIAVTGATSGFARVRLAIDLSQVATTTDFEQANMVVDYAITQEGFPALADDDINGAGVNYDFKFCILSLGNNGITAVVEQPATSQSAAQHIADHNNPHGVTAAQANAKVSGAVESISTGGTGATTAAGACVNLGVLQMSVVDSLPATLAANTLYLVY